MSLNDAPPEGFPSTLGQSRWYSEMRSSLKDIDSGFLTDQVSINKMKGYVPLDDFKQFGGKGSSAYIAATKMVIPPATAGFGAIKAQFQDVSGGLPAGLGSGTLFKVAESSFALVSGGIDLSSAAGGSAALNIAREAFETVPILGTLAVILGGIFDAVMGKQAAMYADLAEKAGYGLENWKRKTCYLSKELEARHLKVGEKYYGAPSNLFLFNAYDAYKREAGTRFLPPTMGSIYVMLCGGETQGYGFTRPQYAEFLKYHKGRNIPGIAPPVQRKMWRLIQSIMGQVVPPDSTAVAVSPDAGRSLVPVLNNIVLQQLLAGNIDKVFVRALSHTLAAENSYFKHSYADSMPGAAASTYNVYAEADCAGGSRITGKHDNGCTGGTSFAETRAVARRGGCSTKFLTFDLTDGFMGGLYDLKADNSAEWLNPDGTYDLSAKPSRPRYQLAMGMLTLKQSAIDRLASDTEGAFSGISKMPEWKKGLFATSLLFGTYGLYRAGDYALERWMPSKKA